MQIGAVGKVRPAGAGLCPCSEPVGFQLLHFGRNTIEQSEYVNFFSPLHAFTLIPPSPQLKSELSTLALVRYFAGSLIVFSEQPPSLPGARATVKSAADVGRL